MEVIAWLLNGPNPTLPEKEGVVHPEVDLESTPIFLM
jgi:hypothetical protein